MTTSFSPPVHTAVPLPSVMEETGLHVNRIGHVLAPMTVASYEPTVLTAAADLLRASLPAEFLDPFAPVDTRDQAVAAVLRDAIVQARQTGGLLGRLRTDMDQIKLVFAHTLGWGPAQRYLDDPRVTEVKIVGTSILVQEIGQPFVIVRERFDSEAAVTSRAKLLADILGVTLDANHPQQSLALAHGTRMHVTIFPAVTNGTNVMIRRDRNYPWDVNDLLARGAMDAATAELLRLLCRAKASVLVVGSTGSGKTTLLEALANSWEDQPHVVTIEDNVQELQLRPGVPWTREQVNTTKDPNDFSLKAREALRQTPGLLLPGETRSYEAGAILSLLTSDHAVMTSIHAMSASDGLERFASCAALPQAYMYSNRRADALRDTTNAFDIAVFVEHLPASGRRVISEIVLSCGIKEAPGGLVADTLTLVRHDIDDEGKDVWTACVQVLHDALFWLDGTSDRVPVSLMRKLRRAQAARLTRSVAPSIDVAAEAIGRAESLLATGSGERAVEALRLAWAERPDSRLLQLAQRAIPLCATDKVERWKATNAQLTGKLEAAMQHNRWSAAAAALNDLLGQLEVAEVRVPAGGWHSVQRQIEVAQAAAVAATQVLNDVRDLLDAERSRAALLKIDELGPRATLLERPMQQALLEARVRALRGLVARGDATAQALETAEARMQGLRAMIAAENQQGADK